jgi:hypothetical protein
MERPSECPVCYESLTENNPLTCGHWLHIDCVKKHFKPECPICRFPLPIQVTGIPPSQSRRAGIEDFNNQVVEAYRRYGILKYSPTLGDMLPILIGERTFYVSQNTRDVYEYREYPTYIVWSYHTLIGERPGNAHDFHMRDVIDRLYRDFVSC